MSLAKRATRHRATLSGADFHESRERDGHWPGVAGRMTESIRVCRGTNRPPKLDDGGRDCATPDAATPALCVDANFTIAVRCQPASEKHVRRPDVPADDPNGMSRGDVPEDAWSRGEGQQRLCRGVNLTGTCDL